MVNLQYFKRTEPLDLEYHLEGPAILSGMDRRQAMDYAEEVRRNLDDKDYLPLGEFIELSTQQIQEREIREKYSTLYNYLQAVYNGQIREPLFILIGGTACSRKDALITNLRNYLPEFYRVTDLDGIREKARTELEMEWGGREKVPKELQPVFERVASLDENGIEIQNRYIQKRLETHWINEAYRECSKTGGFHPWYACQGINISPRVEQEINVPNKLIVIVNPPAHVIVPRVLIRQDKEQRTIRIQDLPKHERAEAERQLKLECRNTVRYGNFLEQQAREQRTPLITESSNLEVLHKFGDYLMPMLERTLTNVSITV